MRSTKRRLVEPPVYDYFKNFIFSNSGGHVWVGYRMKSKDLPINDINFFEEHNQNGKGLYDHDQYEYHQINIPEAFDIDNQIGLLKDHYIQGELKDVANTYLDVTSNILVKEASSINYRTYLFVKLTNVPLPSNPIEYVKMARQTFGHSLVEMFGFKEVSDKVVDSFIEQEEDLFGHLNLYEPIERITEADYELCTYFMYHPADPYLPTRELSSTEINEGTISNHNGYIKIEQRDRTHYIATLAMVDTPSSVFGSSWIQKLQDSVSFAIMPQTRFRFENNEKDKRINRKMRKRLFQQEKDRSMKAEEEALFDEDEVLLFGQERLQGLHKGLNEGEQRLLRADLHLTVAADSLEELEKRVERLEYAHENSKFKLYRPEKDQLTYFNQGLIGSPFNYRVFEQTVSTGFIADLGMNLVQRLGNNVGFPLGRLVTSLKNIENVAQAIQVNAQVVWLFLGLAKKAIPGASIANGNTLIVGPPGEGKSYLAKLIFLWSAFFGQKVLYLEPKNEMIEFVAEAREKYSHIPEFMALLDRIHFITIDKKEENRGILDPLLFMEREEAVSTARQVLYRLGKVHLDPKVQSTKELVINKAISSELDEAERPSMSGAIQRIYAVDKELAETLESYSDGIGKVLIGTPESKAISFDHTINVVGMQGAQPATKEILEAGMETDDMRASAIVLEVMNKLVQVFSINKDEDAMVVIDEFKSIEDSPAGSFIIEDNLRKGRANGTDIVLLSQMLVDAANKDELISYKFAYKPKSDESIENLLNYFELAPNSANIQMVKQMKPGIALFSDHQGRKGLVAVDALFEEWHEMLKTTKQNSEQTQFALEMERVG